MLVLALFGCGEGAGGSGAVIDASELWAVEPGTLYTMRRLDAGTPPAADTATLDATNHLLAYVEEGGCADQTGWRLTFRYGESWTSGSPEAGLHLSSPTGNPADALSLCGYDDALGTFSPVEPALPWWAGGRANDGATVTEGEWSVTATQQNQLVTYYGVFPVAASFALAGPGGGPSGWTLSLAPRVGLVLVETGAYTGDLVDVR